MDKSTEVRLDMIEREIIRLDAITRHFRSLLITHITIIDRTLAGTAAETVDTALANRIRSDAADVSYAAVMLDDMIADIRSAANIPAND